MNNIEMLRIVADDYDQAQRVRVAKGEQIRSIVRGVDLAVVGPQYADFRQRLRAAKVGDRVSLGTLSVRVKPSTANRHLTETQALKHVIDVLLKHIKQGDTDQPHPYLAWTYRASCDYEQRAFEEMMGLVTEHPVWPWMDAVNGIGPTLACKLLARFDIERASSASSFWCYAGLGTVPGRQYRCPECGRTDIYPETYDVSGKHKGCKGISVETAGPDDGVRAAQPRAERGEKRSYDAYAKKTLYLVAGQFIKLPGKSWYEDAYRRKRSYYERERPGWEKGRKHYAALRHIEKLFLSHLYEAWCEAVGKEAARPYAEVHLGHTDIVGPWDVVEWERKAVEKVA